MSIGASAPFFFGHRDELGLAEEMADVIVMLVYISEICNVSFNQVYKALNVKLDRIEYRSNLIRGNCKDSNENQV